MARAEEPKAVEVELEEEPRRARGSVMVAHQQPVSQVERCYQVLQWRTRPGLKPRPDAGSRCVSVSLAHLVGSDHHPDHIYQETISDKLEGDALDDHLREIADRVCVEFMSHAASGTTVETYALVLYGQKDFVLQQHKFTAGPSAKDMIVGGLSEPPNEQGMLGQMMRHGEVGMRQMCEANARALEAHERTSVLMMNENDRLRAVEQSLRVTIDALQAKVMAYYELMEGLRDGKAKRDMEMEEAREWMKRGERVMSFVIEKIGPEVLAKYGVGGELGGAPAQLKGALDELSKMDPEELAEMLAALKPNRQKALWDLLPDEKKTEFQAHMANGNGKSGNGSVQ